VVEIFTTAGIAPDATSVKESGCVITFATGAGDFTALIELAKPNTDAGGSPHRHVPASRAQASILK
jgi:hypothetical protein